MDDFYNNINKIYKDKLFLMSCDIKKWNYIKQKKYSRLLISHPFNDKNTYFIIELKLFVITIFIINNKYCVHNFNINFLTDYKLFRNIQKLFQSNSFKNNNMKLIIYNVEYNEKEEKLLNSMSDNNIRNLKINKLQHNKMK